VDTRAPQTVRKSIASIVVLLLVAHVLLCIYFSVTPRQYRLHRTALGMLYHRVFLIGPFFTEERIASSTHLCMRYKVKGGSWSAPTIYTDHVHQGASLLFQYNALKHDDLVRYFAKAYTLHKKNQKKSDRQLCLLCQYSINELIPSGEAVDSINLVFIHNTFLKNNAVGKTDTVWNVTVNPERCVIR